MREEGTDGEKHFGAPPPFSSLYQLVVINLKKSIDTVLSNINTVIL